MTDEEIAKMIDDGCPHTDGKDESISISLSEALVNPDAFVAGMSQSRVYCMFVPFRPTILRSLIGKEFCVNINPFAMGGKDGSLIETMCKEDMDKLQERFYPSPQFSVELPSGEEERPDAAGGSSG